MKDIPVTAIVMTKNEALVIGRTVRSLADLDQILVVDSMSTDDTVNLARNNGADVIKFEWNGRYPKKKQWSIENAAVRNRWVLFVDADEYVSQELVAELRSLDFGRLQESGTVAFDVDVAYYFCGSLLEHGHRVCKRALLDKQACNFPEVDDLQAKRMWEVEGHYQPFANGRVGKLRNSLAHKDEDSLFDYFSRHNRYSDWEAYLRANPQAAAVVRKARTGGGQVFDRLPFKPILFFVWSYIIRRGFLDGRPGFDYALFLAFYYWQTDLKFRRRDF